MCPPRARCEQRCLCILRCPSGACSLLGAHHSHRGPPHVLPGKCESPSLTCRAQRAGAMRGGKLGHATCRPERETRPWRGTASGARVSLPRTGSDSPMQAPSPHPVYPQLPWAMGTFAIPPGFAGQEAGEQGLEEESGDQQL